MTDFDFIIKRVEMHIMSSFIAQRIISGFSDIIYKHEKGEP